MAMTPYQFLSHVRSGETTIEDELYARRLIEALIFYMGEKNYLPYDSAGNSPISHDMGNLAKSALCFSQEQQS